MSNPFESVRPKAAPGPSAAPRKPRAATTYGRQYADTPNLGQDREANRAAAIEREALSTLASSRSLRNRHLKGIP